MRNTTAPSAWVRPGGDWGAGTVRLLEIPTDNRVQRQHCGVLDARAAAQGGRAGGVSSMTWCGCGEKPDLPAIGRAVATRSGALPGQARARRFMVDFFLAGIGAAGGRLQARDCRDRVARPDFQPEGRVQPVPADVAPAVRRRGGRRRRCGRTAAPGFRKGGVACTET